MEEIINSIKKFEHENNFQILPFIQSKNGFDLIKGFHQAFDQYKTEINRIENMYTAFFNGKGFNKIIPEYMRVIWNAHWFLEIITHMKKHFQSVIIEQNKSDYSDFFVDITQANISCNQFYRTNQANFELYNSYFYRLETAFKFHEEDYITFKEYKDNINEIERLELEEFKKWVYAQKLSGKL